MRISDWSSDVCSSDLLRTRCLAVAGENIHRQAGRSVYGILQRLASLEGRIFCGGDLDFLAGARVAAGPGGAGAHVEGTEADPVDALAGLQGSGDRTDHGIECATGVCLGQTGACGEEIGRAPV